MFFDEPRPRAGEGMRAITRRSAFETSEEEEDESEGEHSIKKSSVIKNLADSDLPQTGKPGELLLHAASVPGQPACKVVQEKRN